MPFRLGPTELIIILLIIILLFGPGRLSKTAGEFGKGIRAFRDGLKGPEATTEAKPAEQKNDSAEGKS
ncbi:MAG: twin-arginine translocase TatA/TatE family subunit [Chloroflexi bacterium]|nr:twin-arginine translocase TatA/TatE family subunit [Chloroflexota bacterium]MBI3761574.1 twin-arginine translocase TatA/TatE family subunit [Chloroflexota bacterium]